jgi:D-amino-acid dehydrogenase
MKIAIVGAGIVGVTTAYELAADGHAVTVFDRHSAAATQDSFATGGLLAPAAAIPWAIPGPLAPTRWLGRQAPLHLGRQLSLSDLSWLRQWRRAAAPRPHGAPPASLAVLELARYSQARLLDLAQQLDLPFEHSAGALLLLRSARDAEATAPLLKALRETGHTALEVDADAARRIEPGLSPTLPLAGALHLPEGLAGNCRQFALLLRQAAQRLGADFQWSTAVERICTTPTGVQMQGEASPRPFDAVVLCAGAQAAPLLRPLGLRLPLAALHGSTLSAPLREALHAPQSVVVDIASGSTMARLGQRVRIAGGAELGRAHQAHPHTLHTLYRVLGECFPGGVTHASGVQVWRGARAMLPDGAPALGPSGAPGVWLNLGHGASGWALACGSARLLADQLAQRPPALPADAWAPQRWQ